MKQKNKHFAVILPTLMDDVMAVRWFTGFWPLRGLTPVVLKFGWKGIKNEDDFKRSLDKAIAEVDRLAKLGRVSLVGCSAGGSVAINIFSQRKNIVHRVIDVCGALRPGVASGKFDTAGYLKALELCGRAMAGLDEEGRKRIMTIRPRFGDEFVKAEQVSLPGAVNITVPTFEHMLSIMLSLTLFSKSIFRFLKWK